MLHVHIDGCILICRGKTYELEAIVSPEDYEWAIEQGNWFVTHGARLEKRIGPMKTGYACRSIPSDPKRGLMWLHKEVLLRSVGEPPTPLHTIGDHRNGNRLDCRRGNLRWATPKMNANNLFGFASRQLELDI